MDHTPYGIVLGGSYRCMAHKGIETKGNQLCASSTRLDFPFCFTDKMKSIVVFL